MNVTSPSREPPSKKLRQTTIKEAFRFTLSRQQGKSSCSGHPESEPEISEKLTAGDPEADTRFEFRAAALPERSDYNQTNTCSGDGYSETFATPQQNMATNRFIDTKGDLMKEKESMTKSGSSPTHAPSGGSQQDGSQAPRDGSILPIREEEAGVKTEEWRGVALSELNHAPTCSAPLSKLEASRDHSLLIRPPVIAGIIPCPHPDKYHDAWDENHVRMPCSSNNLYPKTSPQRGKTLQMRWELIETVLLGNMQSSLDLEEAILVYNARYAARWTFGSLHELFTDRLSRREADDILRYTLPKMAELALQLPFVVTRPIRLLKHGCTHSLTFSQHQVACLLANAFFCTFPRRNSTSKQCEYQNFPTINFSALYSGSGHGGGSGGGGGGRKLEKLKTLLHYFRRVTRKMPTGTVTYRRQHLSNLPDWEGSTHQLPRLHLSATGKIEDEGQGMLQVDFANRWVGGGALGGGLVQEEIRFMICPEMIIARLFTEVLQPDECLVMTGCERFSSYSGYGDDYNWTGDYVDTSPRDAWGRRLVEVVAMDALHYSQPSSQYCLASVTRELNKAYVGFHSRGAPQRHLPAVATGNWGCGAFRGDPHLKSLIQLMAAAQAGRDLCYFTFGDTALRDSIWEMYRFLQRRRATTGDILALLKRYEQLCAEKSSSQLSLYSFIYSAFKGADGSDTDQQIEGLQTYLEGTAPLIADRY